MVKNLSSRAERFPKTLFALSRCRITRASGSGDLLSRPPVHADARDEVDYDGGAAVRRCKSSFKGFPNLEASRILIFLVHFFMREVVRIY